MRRTRLGKTLLVIGTLAALSCGPLSCTGGQLETTVAEVETQLAQAEAAKPPTAVATDTLLPTHAPTHLPPVSTSTPIQTTAFQKSSSAQVVNGFSSAGLEAENPRLMTRDHYGMAPMTAMEGTRFLVPSLGEDSGGRIFSFASEQDLQQMRRYYVELGSASALFFSWVFTKDNMLVQINGGLPEEKAGQYEAALNGMR